jgi:hypothetical protein
MAKHWQYFPYPFPGNGFYRGTTEVSLNHTLPISLCYSTHKVFKPHVKSSQADFLYSSVLFCTPPACLLVCVLLPLTTQSFSLLLHLRLTLMLRPTVSRLVCLGIEHQSGDYNQVFIIARELRFVDVGRSLWREDGSVVYNCCWPSPAQSSGASPAGLITIFYCLRFKTSFFVVSYYSQGYGGGIRPCLQTGISLM